MENSIWGMMNDELCKLFVKELNRSAGSAEETATMAPIHTQIFPPQRCVEIWNYIFAITVRCHVEILFGWAFFKLVGAAVSSMFIYLSVFLLLIDDRDSTSGL